VNTKTKFLIVASALFLGGHFQNALANPFDGDWVLDKSKMKQSEIKMSQELKRQGINESTAVRLNGE